MRSSPRVSGLALCATTGRHAVTAASSRTSSYVVIRIGRPTTSALTPSKTDGSPCPQGCDGDEPAVSSRTRRRLGGRSRAAMSSVDQGSRGVRAMITAPVVGSRDNDRSAVASATSTSAWACVREFASLSARVPDTRPRGLHPWPLWNPRGPNLRDTRDTAPWSGEPRTPHGEV